MLLNQFKVIKYKILIFHHRNVIIFRVIKMFYKFTLNFGKPVCVILYAVFAVLAAKKIWIPLALLALLHFSEYFISSHKVAKDKNIGQLTAFVNCLCFGFTWWLPVRNGDCK